MISRPGRCVVMGILNVTPDSFSDGGRHATVEAAVAHGLHMAAAGADYIDVGGESTRPGADRVSPEEECRRVLPVVAELARLGLAVSIDTTRASVATAALRAGAVMVNDVSGGLADPGMAPTVADAGVPWVLMHRRGESRDMYAQAVYDDVVADVRRELCERVDAALAAGVAADLLVAEGNFPRPAIVVDPDPSLRVVTQEQFGPVIPVIPFDDDADAVRLANDTWAGLCASVWTADTDSANRIGGQLECGYVWVNDHGAARLDLRAPFGGMKHSGMGREQGIEGVRAFQDTRSIAHAADATEQAGAGH